MKKLFLVLAISVFIISCKKGDEPQPQQSSSSQVVATPTPTVTPCFDITKLTGINWLPSTSDSSFLSGRVFDVNGKLHNIKKGVISPTNDETWSINPTDCNTIDVTPSGSNSGYSLKIISITPTNLILGTAFNFSIQRIYHKQ